ncbi:MAG TPA: glycoside hydrolase family 13 protein [Proteiniclasticum sp.]|nr:glycoside hydrolase family 13 protein [Proteiniclasticum sp.]
MINIHALHHQTTNPYAYAKDKDHLYVRLRTAKDDFSEIKVYYRDRYLTKNIFKIKTLKKSYKDMHFDYYDEVIDLERNRYAYYFLLRDQEGKVWYMDERGAWEKKPRVLRHYAFPYIAEEDVYEGEDWLKKSICYQIFPDRFHRSEDAKVIVNEKKLTPWGDTPANRSHFGGNIKGITEKIPYLQDLGITLLYFTPLFESTSNHKYNTKDYYKIDPNFGTLEETKEMVSKCHDAGIRVVFDAVFNHTGHDFFAFEDVLSHQEESRYKDWYHLDSFPVSKEKVNYYTFANYIAYMPKINLKNTAAREYFLDVARYWIKETGIDGYRLDVCDELSHSFLKDLRKVVKETKNDAVIIGEIMHEAESFLEGNELDSIMNYPFRHAMIDTFAREELSLEEFFQVLIHNQTIYREEITHQMLNLLGSHDTPRFLTETKGSKEKLKLATAFQFLYKGVPYVYYGDEVGISGGKDPLCRRTMIWDEKAWDQDLLGFFKDTIRVRKENEVLVDGDFQVEMISGRVFSFSRNLEGKRIIVFFNLDKRLREITLPEIVKGRNLYTGERVVLDGKIELKGLSFIALEVDSKVKTGRKESGL